MTVAITEHVLDKFIRSLYVYIVSSALSAWRAFRTEANNLGRRSETDLQVVDSCKTSLLDLSSKMLNCSNVAWNSPMHL